VFCGDHCDEQRSPIIIMDPHYVLRRSLRWTAFTDHYNGPTLRFLRVHAMNLNIYFFFGVRKMKKEHAYL